MKYEDLKMLDELRTKGSITEEEYQREKSKILNQQDNVFGKANAKPLFGMQENTYLMLMHLSQFSGLILPLLGFVAPILMWILNKKNNPNVDLHGKNIANFMISYFLYCVILAITIIGIPLLLIVGILYIIFVIIGALRANNGIYWKYPMTIQFIK